MTWIRLNATWYEDKALRRAGWLAKQAFVAALVLAKHRDWSVKGQRRGFLPYREFDGDEVARIWSAPAAEAERFAAAIVDLTREQFLVRDDEAGGWWIRNWEKYQRDPGNAKDAYDNFQELIQRFPQSQYVADARLRMVALRNNMAMYEVHVADFYLRRKAYVAAVNRANHIIKEYQRTPAVPHALKIMQEGYLKLGMTDLAADAERVFNLNYPNGIPVADYKEKTFMEDTWEAIGMDK